MNEQVHVPGFKDSPDPQELLTAIANWPETELPSELKDRLAISDNPGFLEIARLLRSGIASVSDNHTCEQFRKLIIAWIYSLIRLNIKRGRIFDLREVLQTGRADCLGYAKVFTILGRLCGLDSGVVEVIIDNRGVTVPHTAVLVRLAVLKPQFLDFWYGSQDIHHRRLGLSVKRDGSWQVEDINYPVLDQVEDISYLPDACVDGITLYIEGNRSLKREDYSRAVEQYSQAIRLYPQNARIYYNRAIAYENLGQIEKARTDYARALQDESSIIRTLATQPEDVVDLIRLDEENLSEEVQHRFLLGKGFITGIPVNTG